MLLTFHPFADGGVLHRAGSHRLWVLNTAAATLWCLLDGTKDAEGLVCAYHERFGIDRDAARRDVTTLLPLFQELLAEPPAPAPDLREWPVLAPPPAGNRLKADLLGLPRLLFNPAGACFAVTVDDDGLARQVRALLGHLAAHGRSGCVETELAVVKGAAPARGGPYAGFVNGRLTAPGLTPEESIPFLIGAMFDNGMAGLCHRLLFHAAVVARDDRALILAAPSGGGKSTLAAALAASGWSYLSDELAVVDPRTLEVAPFALPVSLKDHSVGPLDSFIPAVAALPRHVRADGVGVRYYRPARIQASPLPAAALVFPRYRSGARAAANGLPPIDALSRLAAAGSSARPLLAGDIDAILALAGLPAFSLDFADLGEAVGLLERSTWTR